MKFKEIVALATKVKTYIEKNHTFPTSIKQDNKTYTYAEIAYYFVEFIRNNGKEVKDRNVKVNTNSSGVTITELITENDYKDQAKRISQFIVQNGKIPNNVTTVKSKKTVRPRDYIFAFAKIIVFYAANYRFPNTCKYDSTIYTVKSASTTKTSNVSKNTTKKKYGHSTISGCDNRGQNTSVYCGPHSLQECIRNLTGKVIKQSTLASWAGTGSGGTDHQGLNTAVAKASKQLGIKLTVQWYNFSELGWNGLIKLIQSNNKDFVIHNLYRRKWGHYETVNAISGSNVKVQNSLGDKCSHGCYCGYVENRSASEFKSYINGISQKSVMVITRVD